MKLKMAQIESLFAAHNNLNGYVRKATINNQEVDVMQPYTFNAATTLAILANRKALRKKVEANQEMRNDLIKQISGGTKIDGAEQKAAFFAAYQALMDAEHDLELKTVKMSDLNPGPSNPISIDALDLLEPVIEAEPATENPSTD